jgi:hypothetical protein
MKTLLDFHSESANMGPPIEVREPEGTTGTVRGVRISRGPPLRSRTRWTDEDWRGEYWKITSESPEDLIKRASKRRDDRVLVILDLIQNGDPYDKRRKRERGREDRYRMEPMNWHLLCELVKLMREALK